MHLSVGCELDRQRTPTGGPAETTRLFYFNEIYLVGAMQVLCRYNVPQHVPLQGTISMLELASKTGLGEGLLARFVRMAATGYYFTEPRPGFIAHTAWSKTLATDEKMTACVWFRHTEVMSSVAKLVEAVEKHPGSAEPQDVAFTLAFGDTFFDYKKKHSDRMVKFGLYADAFASGIEADTAESIARAYAWDGLPADSLVVDVGGGIGHISAAVAREHAHLKFQIQDFGDLAEESSVLLQENGVADRVRFHTHTPSSTRSRKPLGEQLFTSSGTSCTTGQICTVGGFSSPSSRPWAPTVASSSATSSFPTPTR
jgi:hypothetical protein